MSTPRTARAPQRERPAKEKGVTVRDREQLIRNIVVPCLFFFSSRRRHTRWTGDWSSDVCSSDLVHWRTCASSALQSMGLKCARIKVPLDYRHPRRSRITLALTMRPHRASAGKYLGPILTNPGGPGGSGLTLPILQHYVPGNVGYRFDWIGFDPRGVGSSRPVLHCKPGYVTYDRPSYVPTTAGLMNYWRTKTRAYAKACGSSPARRLLPFMTTADNARDMNSIRKALGVRKISYYG